MGNPGSGPWAETIFVEWSNITGGTATAYTDYTPRSGSFVFTRGQTSKTITIESTPDNDIEPDETFLVKLINADVAIDRGTGTGTILNDDLSAISINNVSKNEGSNQNQTTPFTFTVSLDHPGIANVSVYWQTEDGTAGNAMPFIPSPGGPTGWPAQYDYWSKSGLITFAPGEVNKTIVVNVVGDGNVEPNETFFVKLSSPTNATIAGNTGQGTIVNDD